MSSYAGIIDGDPVLILNKIIYVKILLFLVRMCQMRGWKSGRRHPKRNLAPFGSGHVTRPRTSTIEEIGSVQILSITANMLRLCSNHSRLVMEKRRKRKITEIWSAKIYDYFWKKRVKGPREHFRYFGIKTLHSPNVLTTTDKVEQKITLVHQATI